MTIDDAATLKAKQGEISDYWTSHPMIFPGLDWQNSSPEEIFAFMDQQIREKAPWYHKPGEGLFSALIDYPALAGKKVLEIGFGTGKMAYELVKVGAEFHGVDLSKTHKALCDHRFAGETNVDFRLASGADLPFEDEYFDFAISWGVIMHAEDDLACFREFYRTLKPGGRAFLMLYRKGGIKYYYQKLFKQGILQLGLLKHGFNVASFINSVTDKYSKNSPGAPISRHYTEIDVRRIFLNYEEVDIRIEGGLYDFSNIPFRILPISDWILGQDARIKLGQKYGGFWLIDLKKPERKEKSA